MNQNLSFHDPDPVENFIKATLICCFIFICLTSLFFALSTSLLSINFSEFSINVFTLKELASVILTHFFEIFLNIETDYFFNLFRTNETFESQKIISYLSTFKIIYYVEIIPIVIALVLSFFSFKPIYKSLMTNEVQLKGIKFTKNEKQASKEFAAFEKIDYSSYELKLTYKANIGGVVISRDRQSKHILVVGGTGAGKTTMLDSTISSATNSNDLCIIFCNKGDYTQVISNNKNKRPILIAPWDARSWVHDIGFDCTTKQQAIELSSKLIPQVSNQEDLWNKGARLILTGLIIKLQKDFKEKWGWSELKNALEIKSDELYNILVIYYPEAANIVKVDEQGDSNETTDSLLITMYSQLLTVYNLADAYANSPNKKFSIKKFIAKKYESNVLILQGNVAMQSLQNASIHSILGLFTSLVTSNAYPERPSYTDGIWLFLDEFPQLGYVPFLQKILEVGRSKNVKMCIACQAIAQIDEVYGDKKSMVFKENFGTILIGKSSDSTAKWFMAATGKKEIERLELKYDNKNNLHKQPVRVISDAVTQEDLTSELGFFYEKGKKKGVKIILWALDQQLYRLKCYFQPPKKILRKAHIPAIWCKDVIWNNYEKTQINKITTEL